MTDRFSVVWILVLFLSWTVAFEYITQNTWAASSGSTGKKTSTITRPGVDIYVPKRAPSKGPIPVKVKMIADMKIYSDNNGLLDKALDVVLIRRDAPGLWILRKMDPKVWMEPEIPLPPSTPGTDLNNAGFINEERQFDVLDFGATHDGAADYYVLASFAGRVTRPMPLSIENKSRRLPAGHTTAAPLLTAEVKKNILKPPASPGVVFKIKDDSVTRIEGGVRGAVLLSGLNGNKPCPPFMTIVAVRLAPTGGISTGLFLLDADVKGGDYLAQFSIPVTHLAPPPDPGEYLMFVFSSDEWAKPIPAVLRLNPLNKGQ
ncbi:MAG: hypothetical protein GY860_27795 [Desulfobacteraceae bacterium]|nr:hypothetical protein [Desulfobacteraceae bacterium]